MDKRHILAEIRRTAAENGGKPLGRQAFYRETGVSERDWYGKYWARWGDALQEAGFSPNTLQGAFPVDELLGKLASLVEELGHFPVQGELLLKSRSDPTFPNPKTFARLGPRRQVAERLIEYCRRVRGLDHIVAACEARVRSLEQNGEPELEHDRAEQIGYVYMIRSGRHYKIGKTNAAGRRERELAIQLPERTTTVHVIRTDDPTGIEAYWHRRFEAKRKHGEWFELSAADVLAFKRRKFM